MLLQIHAEVLRQLDPCSRIVYLHLGEPEQNQSHILSTCGALEVDWKIGEGVVFRETLGFSLSVNS